MRAIGAGAATAEDREACGARGVVKHGSDVTNALSFDIEDWFHLVGINAVADPASWPSLPSLVESRTRQILAMLAEHGVRATFFVLGWVAERYPGLVGEIGA